MKKSQRHTIDFLFPISIFFVFSATAVVILVLAANIYKNIVNDSDVAFTETTALTYVSEKIRQNDSSEATEILLSEFDGCTALTLVEQLGHTSYTTYIYEYEGELKELFIQSDVEASALAGATILKVHDFEMEEIASGIYKFSCIQEDGSSDSIIISLRSE